MVDQIHSSPRNIFHKIHFPKIPENPVKQLGFFARNLKKGNLVILKKNQGNTKKHITSRPYACMTQSGSQGENPALMLFLKKRGFPLIIRKYDWIPISSLQLSILPKMSFILIARSFLTPYLENCIMYIPLRRSSHMLCRQSNKFYYQANSFDCQVL